jgi:predicted esterase
MRLAFAFFLASFASSTSTSAQITALPGQPTTGPGSSEHYVHAEAKMLDCAEEAHGYWLFEPASPIPDSASVIVFMHGYGAYNPMVYGKWIKHLVAQGNIVIYPRYQLNLFAPKTDKFPETAARGIKDAIYELNTNYHAKPKLDQVVYIGHSYGGAICAWMGVHWEALGVPKPAAMLLAQPGTGPLNGVILDDYSGMPADMHLITIAGSDDVVVGEKMARRVFDTAIHTAKRNMVLHFTDKTTPKEAVLGTHHEAYSIDYDLDSGVRNYTALRTIRTSAINEVDFYCYWKLADALIYYTRKGIYEEYAFGDTEQQKFMGKTSDGRPFTPMQVWVPDVDVVGEITK